MHLMPFPGKFSLHHLGYGNNAICVGKECVGEKTNFHEDSTSNVHRTSFELLLYVVSGSESLPATDDILVTFPHIIGQPLLESSLCFRRIPWS
jgi:hypothetical protein